MKIMKIWPHKLDTMHTLYMLCVCVYIPVLGCSHANHDVPYCLTILRSIHEDFPSMTKRRRGEEMKEVMMDGLLVVLDFLLAFLSPAVSYSKPQVMLLCILVGKRER